MDRDAIFSQLDRLRWAFIRTLAAILVAAIAGYAVSRPLLEFLHRPLESVPLRFLRLTEPFFAYIKVALFAGLFVVLPFIIRELWLAVAPIFIGDAARKYVWGITLAASVLFYAGATICYVFVLGAAVPFLLNFGGDQLQPFLSVSDYLGLVMTLLLASGVMFELPLVLLVLGRVGIVNAKMLSRFRRYAVVLNAVVAAVLTPTPDAYTMLLMMLPLLVLYELSVILVRIFGKPRAASVSAAAT